MVTLAAGASLADGRCACLEQRRAPRNLGAMTSLTRPRGPLPRRVYWVRRGLVLGVAVLLVVGVARLLGAGGGSDPDTATIVRGEPTSTATGSVATGTPTATATPTRKRKGLAVPEGPCDPADVVVTPTVPSAHVAQPVRIVLEVTPTTSPACTFEVSPESVIVRLMQEERSDPLWSTQQCPATVPERTVVARPDRPGRVGVLWNGRTSDDECSNLTRWVFPGTYRAEAIAVGSSTAGTSDFVLGLPIRPTVTRTPTPTAKPTAGPGSGSTDAASERG